MAVGYNFYAVMRVKTEDGNFIALYQVSSSLNTFYTKRKVIS